MVCVCVHALHLRYILFVRMHDPLFVKSAVLGRHLTLLCVTGGGFIFVRPFIYSQQKKRQYIQNKYHPMMVIKTFSFNNLRLHYCYIMLSKAFENYYVLL